MKMNFCFIFRKVGPFLFEIVHILISGICRWEAIFYFNHSKTNEFVNNRVILVSILNFRASEEFASYSWMQELM